MKKYLIFSLFLSLFALSNANAAVCCVNSNDCYPSTTVRYPATETTACYDTVPCAPCYDACDNSGMYVGLIGGANWLDNHHAKHEHLKLNVGYLAGGSVGYAFGNGFRLEGEVSYRHNGLKHRTENSLAEVQHHHTRLHSWTYMVNGFYDIDLDSDFTLYLGIGIGYLNQSFNFKNFPGIKIHSDGLAWQAIGGVSYAIDAKTSIAVEYRYLASRHHVHNHGANVAIRRAF